MRIAFNGQRLAGQRFGVGRYIEYQLRYWSGMLGADEQVSLFLRRPPEDDLRRLGPRIVPVLLESRMSGIPWENLRLRGPASRHDVLFCPAYTAPVSYRGPLTVAVHSVDDRNAMGHSWSVRHLYGRLHRHCARNADAVIVPSEVIKAEVIESYAIPAERIAVVPQGADDAFQPIEDPALLSRTRTKFFGGDRPYVLFVGKCSARRNIPLLLRAFAELRRSRRIPHGLVLFGPNHVDLPLKELCEELRIVEDVVQTDGKLERHADLVPIYCAADVFVHPSEYEGWSITTVEAMACGTAVIASDRGGLGEVARGHALMMPEPSVDALVDAIGRVLEDAALRSDLQRRARERGRALRWEIGTRDTLNVVRAVGNGGRGFRGPGA